MKVKKRSKAFINYHLIRSVVKFLNDIKNDKNAQITPKIFDLFSKIILSSKSLYGGDISDFLPEIDASMDRYELLLIFELYLATAESFLSEEERHILLKGLDILEKLKRVVG